MKAPGLQIAALSVVASACVGQRGLVSDPARAPDAAAVAPVDAGTADAGPPVQSANSTTLLLDDGPGLRAIDWRTGVVTPSATIALQALPAAAAAFRSGSGQGCGVGLFPYASFSADGSTVAVGSRCSRPWELRQNTQAELYDVATGALIQPLPAGPLLSSDGTVIALGSALWCR